MVLTGVKELLLPAVVWFLDRVTIPCRRTVVFTRPRSWERKRPLLAAEEGLLVDDCEERDEAPESSESSAED